MLAWARSKCVRENQIFNLPQPRSGAMGSPARSAGKAKVEPGIRFSGQPEKVS